MDIWSDQNMRPYLAMTAHWIATIDGSSALELKAALIAFHRLRGRHDGESLAQTVLQLLDRAGITVKVSTMCNRGENISDTFPKAGHFTLDNASNNETMMKALERLFVDREIAFDADDRKIMCFGHVVDLSSGRVISSVKSAGTALTDDETDLESLNVIDRARAVVRAIRGSGLRRDAFNEVIVNGNAKGWFKQGQPPKTVKLKPLQLLRDVRTRWDSVYHMLNRLRELRPVMFPSGELSPCLNNNLIDSIGRQLFPCASKQ
jgi:hypothetical protein